MLTLKERLLLAEEDFLSALGEGDSALSAFEKRWQTLIHDVDDAMESSTLDAELSMLVHATSLRISILADTSAELADNYNAFTSQLMDQITTLMGDLTVTDDRLYPVQSHNSPPSPASQLSSTPDPTAMSKPIVCSSRKRQRDVLPGSSSLKGSLFKKQCRSLCSTSDSEDCPGGISPTVSSHPTTPLSVDAGVSPGISSSRRHSRKRRLSDADADVIVHSRPKRVHVGPRLHAVSDSFVTYPVLKLDPAMASRPTSASPALDSEIGWDICSLSTLGFQGTPARGVSNDPLLYSFPEPLDSHSPPDLCDLDMFLQNLLTPLPPLVADRADTPLQYGSPVSESSAYGDIDYLDSSPSPCFVSSPSTPPQEVAIEVYPPSSSLYSAEDGEDPAVYGAGAPMSNLAVSCAPKWSEWLDPLDPYVWLSAPPPPYSLGSSCLQLDPLSEIISGSKGNAIVPSLPTRAASTL